MRVKLRHELEETRKEVVQNQRKLYQEDRENFARETERMTEGLQQAQLEIETLKQSVEQALNERNSARLATMHAFRQLESFLCSLSGGARKQMGFLISPSEDPYLKDKWRSLYLHKAVQTEDKTTSRRKSRVVERTRKYFAMLNGTMIDPPLEERLFEAFDK
ncbi:hypothetical protein Ciccas_001885 [Cichlidogyrus casuarinus]|uniref:Uncharacterized protein n=1 Tax=Cichlidogyrus casuarinus TaxID=1844966 RepID=A0ABD2QIU3_9PLAT